MSHCDGRRLMLGRNKLCAVCGYVVTEDDLFCAACGTQLFSLTVGPKRVFAYLEPSQTEPVEMPLEIDCGAWGNPELIAEGLARMDVL